MTAGSGKVELYQRRGDGRWSWRHRATNGQVDASAGQGFHDKGTAKRALRRNPGADVVVTSR